MQSSEGRPLSTLARALGHRCANASHLQSVLPTPTPCTPRTRRRVGVRKPDTKRAGCGRVSQRPPHIWIPRSYIGRWPSGTWYCSMEEAESARICQVAHFRIPDSAKGSHSPSVKLEEAATEFPRRSLCRKLSFQEDAPSRPFVNRGNLVLRYSPRGILGTWASSGSGQ